MKGGTRFYSAVIGGCCINLHGEGACELSGIARKVLEHLEVFHFCVRGGSVRAREMLRVWLYVGWRSGSEGVVAAVARPLGEADPPTREWRSVRHSDEEKLGLALRNLRCRSPVSGCGCANSYHPHLGLRAEGRYVAR